MNANTLAILEVPPSTEEEIWVRVETLKAPSMKSAKVMKINNIGD